MNVIICPDCEFENLTTSRYCQKCGHSLSNVPPTNTPSVPPPPPKSSGQTSQPRPVVVFPSRPGRDYGALRGIAQLCVVLSYGVLILVVIGGIYSLGLMPESFLTGAGTLFAVALVGGFFYIVARVIAESIYVLLDIEENTRLTAQSAQESARILQQRD